MQTLSFTTTIYCFHLTKKPRSKNSFFLSLAYFANRLIIFVSNITNILACYVANRFDALNFQNRLKKVGIYSRYFGLNRLQICKKDYVYL